MSTVWDEYLMFYTNVPSLHHEAPECVTVQSS